MTLLALAWESGSGQATSYLGFAVSSAGDVDGDGYDDIVAGAVEDLGYNQEGGTAALWMGTATGPTSPPAWLRDGRQVYTPCGLQWYGIEVTSAGDVNGDGFADVVVGSDAWAGLYLGSASGLSPTEDWTEGIGSCGAKYGIHDGFGWYVAPLGDVNGDGFDDVAFGTPFWFSGIVDVYGGRISGTLSNSPDWTQVDDEDASWYGSALAGTDVNGDGFGDLIVGAYGAGKVYAYHGSAAGLPALPSWTNEVAEPTRYGWSVAAAGDVNADGYDDVIVSAYPSGGTGGAVFVHHGSPAGLDPSAVVLALDDQIDAGFGYQVAGAGDVDADGYDDVVVGVPLYDATEQDEGAVFVYRGSPAGVQVLPAWSSAPTGQASAWFGFSVAAAGDVNGDGHADIIVGAPYFDGGAGTDEGHVYVFLGQDAPCLGDPLSGDADTDGVCALDAYGGIADCDDADPATYPGAAEVCDGRDNACAGAVLPEELDEDGDGYRPCTGDCDDTDAASHPAATELCDGEDNGCLGMLAADEADVDADGLPTCAGDCDDTRSFAHPDIGEICGDLFDNNCDGVADEACSGPESAQAGCGCAVTRPSANAGFLSLVAGLGFFVVRRATGRRRP